MPVWDGGGLHVITPQEMLDRSAERRARKQLNRGTGERGAEKIFQIRACGSDNEARTARPRSGQRNDAPCPYPARIEQASQRDYVLIADVPNHPVYTDRIEMMDMGSNQTRRMPARETDSLDGFGNGRGGIGPVTDVNGTVGQVTQRLRAETKP
ncbi:hypothetical protein SAMN05892877_13421 [Rhizobium subbaraonis]|uniref:Uncharacterized protein n=1 Tax=Rhizobium subbaraonis TaxID=908946 RepID=A0A285V1H0_9HYPH|nr:hypothetical protein SAMN05892877_13421 [Rhizobium subbaraonis]